MVYHKHVLGMPDTNFKGRRTLMARSVRKLTFAPSSGNRAIILVANEGAIKYLDVFFFVWFGLCEIVADLRCGNNKEIHNIPSISEVGIFMQYQT